MVATNWWSIRGVQRSSVSGWADRRRRACCQATRRTTAPRESSACSTCCRTVGGSGTNWPRARNCYPNRTANRQTTSYLLDARKKTQRSFFNNSQSVVIDPGLRDIRYPFSGEYVPYKSMGCDDTFTCRRVGVRYKAEGGGWCIRLHWCRDSGKLYVIHAEPPMEKTPCLETTFPPRMGKVNGFSELATIRLTAFFLTNCKNQSQSKIQKSTKYYYINTFFFCYRSFGFSY